MGKGPVDLDKLITHEPDTDHWEKAFEISESKEAIKVVLKPVS
jgi:threonine dehydrogenase-like Zn-dependent dehydrogenase